MRTNDEEGASKVVATLASNIPSGARPDGNRIGNEGKLAESLARTSLALGISWIWPRGATEVAAALANHSTLMCLSFHYNTQVNQLGAHGATKLGRSLPARTMSCGASTYIGTTSEMRARASWWGASISTQPLLSSV